MRNILTADAVVLSSTDVGEEDRILTFVTREQGLLRAAASSARSLKKGRTAPLDLFVRSRLDITAQDNKPGRLKRIRSADVLETFLGIRSDYIKLCAASYVSELVSRCVQEDDPAPEIFELILVILAMLEKGEGIYRALVIFESRLLKELGMTPDTETCRKCGTGLGKEIVIDPRGGGFSHAVCRPGNSEALLSPGDLSILRFIMSKDLQSMSRLAVGEERARHLFRQVNRFSVHHLGFTPRTSGTLP
jgi:DNA repair protein RecO (recombination protein O)